MNSRDADVFESIGERWLRMRRSNIFDTPAPFRGNVVDARRVRGMLLGLAIGDALGNSTEGLPPSERRRRHGEIADYLPNRRADERRVGLPSDDTQLAFWTVEHLILNDGKLSPDQLADIFCAREIYGIGKTVAEFRCKYRSGIPWDKAAPDSAGNGALMRIAPVLLPHLVDGSGSLWTDTVLCSAVTHNNSASIAACVAYVSILGQLLIADETPPRDWWADEYVRAAAPIERGASYTSRSPNISPFEGTVSDFVDQHLTAAIGSSDETVTWCDRWHSGAYLLETVPCALLILARYADDPEQAIMRAVNDTKDNDTQATEYFGHTRNNRA